MANMKQEIDWQVDILKKVEKQLRSLPTLPVDVLANFFALYDALKASGPEQPQFKSYGRLKSTPKGEEWHHCHINSRIKNKLPAYVVVWYVYREEKIVEINHVDTHENTDYARFRKNK